MPYDAEHPPLSRNFPAANSNPLEQSINVNVRFYLPQFDIRPGFNTIAIAGKEYYHKCKVGEKLNLVYPDTPVGLLVDIVSLDLVKSITELSNTDVASNYRHRIRNDLKRALCEAHPDITAETPITIIGFENDHHYRIEHASQTTTQHTSST